jgi:hypothetical protein
VTDLAARIMARAALYGAPSTVVSVDEVAYALGRCEEWVRERRAPAARAPDGGRAIVAPFGDWLEARG